STAERGGVLVRCGRWPGYARERTVHAATPFRGVVLGNLIPPLPRGGDPQARHIDALPGPSIHPPGHDGLLAVDQDLGIGEARTSEHISISSFDIIALDLRGPGRGRAEGQDGGAENLAEGLHLVSLPMGKVEAVDRRGGVVTVGL